MNPAPSLYSKMYLIRSKNRLNQGMTLNKGEGAG
jgi:hypothetical protein